jgi:hypothetical protein
LALIIGVWLAMRVWMWESPFEIHRSRPVPASIRVSEGPLHPAAAPTPGRPLFPLIPGPADAPVSAPLPAPWTSESTQLTSPSEALRAPAAEQIVGQQMLLLAAFAHMAVPEEISGHVSAPEGRGVPRQFPDTTSARSGARTTPWPVAGSDGWSGDGWLLLRKGSNGPITAGEPSYGRSQAGAVLRYRLASSTGHRPTAYLRTTRALAGPRESEVAVGLGARPVGRIPVRLAAELRVSEGSAGRELRPAGFAVTEIPEVKLPLGLRVEVYAQAGYVGGRYATAFVDGQARIDGNVTRFGPTVEVLTGGGVWGGGQKHSGRLDIGPSATINFRFGPVLSRVAFDYRMRIAGDASPKSGPALTISAGF